MNKRYWYLIFTSLIIGGFFSLFASSAPDGLEKVAKDQGFIIKALGYPFHTLAPDYAVSGITDNNLAVALAGILGTMTVFATIFAITKIVFCRK